MGAEVGRGWQEGLCGRRKKLELYPEDTGELLKALTRPSLRSLQLGGGTGGSSGASHQAALTRFALHFPGFLLGVVVASLPFCAHVAGELSLHSEKTGIASCVPGSLQETNPAPPDTQRPTDATQVSVHQQMWWTHTVRKRGRSDTRCSLDES